MIFSVPDFFCCQKYSWEVRFLYDLVGGRYRIRTKVLEAHTAVVWAIFINVAEEEIQVQTPRRYQINEKLAGLASTSAICYGVFELSVLSYQYFVVLDR